ncbi:MAG TPA: MEDS domain-containing protein [Dehalococcoidia bacterium]
MPGQIVSFDRGAHACLLFRTFDEQKEVVLPFVRDGLQNGEQCVYVAAEQPVDEWRRELQAYGVDVQTELRNGRLVISSGESWLKADAFDSMTNARLVWPMMEQAFGRFRGIRLVIDAGWMLAPPVSVEALCHWEATINPLIDGDYEARVLCQYNLSRHSAPVIHAALRTHPILLLDGRLRTNPYYEAPLILEREPELNRSDADAGTIEEMLSRLREAE